MTTATKHAPYINESKTIDSKIIQRYNIIGTTHIEYRVWEFSGHILDNNHSCITFIDGKLYGELHSRRVPADLDKLPAWTTERVKAIQAWRNGLDVWEASLIALAYHETANVPR